MNLIFQIFKFRWFRILLVYLICIVADTLWLFEPYMLGKMVDGLLVRNYQWTIIFIITNLIFIGFRYIRRVFDTKVFSKIYNNLILNFISLNINKLELSKIVARTEMSKVITDFLENFIPNMISMLYATLGSLIIIYTLNHNASFIIVIMLIPISFVLWYFYMKIKKMTYVNNSNNELHIEKIQTKNLSTIKDYFNRTRRILIMDSTLNAKNIVAFDFLSVAFIIITLIYFIISKTCTTGDAISFYGYINRFAYSLGSIPYFISTFIKINDVTKRLNMEND